MDYADPRANQRQAAERLPYSIERPSSPMSIGSLDDGDNLSDREILSESGNLSDFEWAITTFERNFTVLSAACSVFSLLYGPRLAIEFFQLFFSATLIPLANSINNMAGGCPGYEDAFTDYVLNSPLRYVRVVTYNRLLMEGATLFNSLFSRFRLVIDDPANPPPDLHYEMPNSTAPPFYLAHLERALEKQEYEEEYDSEEA
ncbi:hypothetical protein F5Y01DRAFT_220637 [Xylaria sp. FL0043]|nr:hypothetical protein F5Y01DRAFT_220637 [Xylaria sp. FL0043]